MRTIFSHRKFGFADGLLLLLTLASVAITSIQCRAQSNYEPYTFTTLAGDAVPGSAARFNSPGGVAVDSAGNIYVADSDNNTIRKVTPAGAVTTLAGLSQDTNGDGYLDGGYAEGTGSGARFWSPSGVAVDSVGNVYVADSRNNTIRKVTPAGVVTTLAGFAGNAGFVDGTGSAAAFDRPSGVAVDSAGNVYVADSRNNTIRKVTATGVVTTLAGLAENEGNADGTGSAARFLFPQGVAVDSAGNVYVADSGNDVIRKVTPAGVVTTLAGLADNPGSADETGSAAWFNSPAGVAVDITGNVHVADSRNNTIRKVTATGVVTTLAGLANSGPGSADGTGSAARFDYSCCLAVDGTGNVYVADSGNHTIRKVTTAGVVTTLAGLAGNPGSADGTGSAARFSYPSGVAVDNAGDIYVADSGNYTIRKVTTAGVVTTLAGLAEGEGNADGTGSAAWFDRPSGVAVDRAGNVYVADTWNFTIRKVTPAGVVTTLAGLAGNGGSADGMGSAAWFVFTQGVAVDTAGNVYVADSGNPTIRKVTPAGLVTTLAGLVGNGGSTDGTGSTARFSGYKNCDSMGSRCLIGPSGVAVDSTGNLYVADTGNNTIRKGYPALMILGSGPSFGFTGSTFGFNLAGPAGQSVVVESSTDLENWLPIWTNTFSGTLSFRDPQSVASSQRFYRSRTE